MPNYQQTFELETYASEHALGVVLMQGGGIVGHIVIHVL
jgi:hypothetical protein